LRTSQVDKGLRTISGTQMSYNQKVPVFQVPFCHIDQILNIVPLFFYRRHPRKGEGLS